jgi:hypothetical protein
LLSIFPSLLNEGGILQEQDSGSQDIIHQIGYQSLPEWLREGDPVSILRIPYRDDENIDGFSV